MGVDWDEIKHIVSIGEVLRKYGFRAPIRDSYRIPCPIHGGRDANFSVDDRNGLWNCFSVCGRGGSVIDLVAALEKITPKEAAMKLSSDFKLSPAQEQVVLARALDNKLNRWNNLKKEAPEVSQPYTIELEEGYRGLTRKTIDYWGLRRVPSYETKDFLGNTTFGWSYPPSGVFIPVHMSNGGMCSYSVRKDRGEPKYFNAPGISKCYPFGLFKNSQDIINEGFCWLVEGQFDAITLWQKGYKNVIALMGSSLSEQQAMLLLALTSKLELCLDGDEAGRLAAAKIRKIWGPVFEIGEFVLPEGVDPDEFTGILERKNDMATRGIRT